MLALELHDQPLDALALQAEIAARRATAADNRQLVLARVGAGLGFGHVNERANDDVRLVVGDQACRHRLERAGEEQIEQQGFGKVVEVMAERDLGRADARRPAVQHAAAEAGAERARGRIRVQLVVDDGADRGVLAVELPVPGRARLGERLMLVALVS